MSTKAYKHEYDMLQSLLHGFDPYFAEQSLKQPWYDCISAGSIANEKHHIVLKEIPSFKVFDILEAFYDDGIVFAERSSLRAGYVPENTVVLLPYRGRFGAGWLFVTNYSKTLVNCKYCLLKDGGLNHGKAKETNSTAETSKG